MSVAELLDQLAQTPRLSGAACRRKSDLFDVTVGGRDLPRREVAQARAQALAICRSCPALAGCVAYVDGLPPELRPRGVIAGRVSTPAREPRNSRGHRFATPTTPLGRRLRELREQRQWGQPDLARAVGTWQGVVSAWELGRRAPDPEALARIADALGVSVSELLRDIV